MVRAQGDDCLAFAELYGRHVEDALRIALPSAATHDRAEETVQDGFFSIWRSRAGLPAALGSFSIWSMRIVHNRAVDSLPRRREAAPAFRRRTRARIRWRIDEDPTLAARSRTPNGRGCSTPCATFRTARRR